MNEGGLRFEMGINKMQNHDGMTKISFETIWNDKAKT